MLAGRRGASLPVDDPLTSDRRGVYLAFTPVHAGAPAFTSWFRFRHINRWKCAAKQRLE